MKKMLSLAAMFAVLSYASPASAELKIGGDAAVRLRSEFNELKPAGSNTNNNDDLKFQYRIRLKAAADLGDGYFFKTLVQSEETAGGAPVAGGWSEVGANNAGAYNLEVSNFYFGRALECCHYSIGRVPLNSVNNPIFDITLYPVPGLLGTSTIYAVDIPVATWNFDRVFGLNYGGKLGDGEFNSTLVVFDNATQDNKSSATGDGIFNDGYALHLSYKSTIGDVKFEPQAIISLTDVNGLTYSNVSPNTFGANATIPAGNTKIGLSGFYTVCKDNKGNITGGSAANVDYNGYLLRAKAESGPITAWVDYNHTTDKTASSNDVNYSNLFVWAQYNLKVHESATGSFSVTPTIRYRTSEKDFGIGKDKNDQLRGELYATVTF
jgi:predicted porin